MAEVAPDGSPVELYALLAGCGEGELVARVLPEGASVLELGCGAGRITRQLVAHGFHVTAVDESAAMLAHVREAETVQARVEGLELGRRFDAVLLASNLLNTEAGQRRAFLETCRRHGPQVVIEMLPLGWAPQSGSEARIGEICSRLQVDAFQDGVVRGRVEYTAQERAWTQTFSMDVFADEQELEAVLAEAGLRLERWLDRDRGWLVASAV